MIEQIKHIEISFNAEWFQSCYSVYILTIKKNAKEIYYYIGQTGDRKHISARSPFYRLIGHYSPYQGTDTQLVKGLIKHKLITRPEGKSLRVCLETAFFNKHVEVKADYFKVRDFDETTHLEKRILVEQVEQLIIEHFVKKHKIIFNDVYTNLIKKARTNDEALAISKEIIRLLKYK